MHSNKNIFSTDINFHRKPKISKRVFYFNLEDSEPSSIFKNTRVEIINSESKDTNLEKRSVSISHIVSKKNVSSLDDVGNTSSDRYEISVYKDNASKNFDHSENTENQNTTDRNFLGVNWGINIVDYSSSLFTIS